VGEQVGGGGGVEGGAKTGGRTHEPAGEAVSLWASASERSIELVCV
jgi:hypothetical protein